MKDKKLLILIILSLFAVLSLIRGMVAPTRFMREASRKGGSLSIQKTKVSQPLKKHPARREAKRTIFADWGRNPFTMKMLSREAFGEGGLRLEGVIWDEAEPYAILNGRVVRKGDIIGKYEVLEIKKNSIQLKDDLKVFELKL